MKKFKAHILVVDDDDRIRDLVKQYLNENNYLVTTAINAEDYKTAAKEGLDSRWAKQVYNRSKRLMDRLRDIDVTDKFDKKGSLDAIRDVKKQYQRNNNRFDEKTENMPVFGTIASQFNDPGTNSLYRSIIICLLPSSFL